MKGLNKLALATAVAAVPFSTQAMEPMSDQAMGETTGQAGVTIELDTQLSIDQVEYSQGTGTGSVLINNVDVGGIGGAQQGDGLDLKVNVDLPSGGQTLSDFGSKAGQDSPLGLDQGNNIGPSSNQNFDAIGTLGGELGSNLSDGDALISVQSFKDDGNGGTAPVDIGIKLGSGDALDDTSNGSAFQLIDSTGTDTATLMSDLNMDIFASQLDIVARNSNVVGDDDSIGSLEIEAGFAIDNLDAQFDVAAVGIEGLRLAGAGSLDFLKEDTVTPKGTGEVLAAGAAIVSMDIGQGDALSATAAGGDGSGPGETLRINLDEFSADIWMPTITVGNASNNSIGSVGIRNLNISNTEIAVYGRD